MVILQAILLGIIEGLTEFLPISSTGHLIVAQNLMHYKDIAEVFTVVIQIGAVAAIVWFYRVELWGRVTGLLQRQSSSIRFWRNWVIATIPAGLAGLLFNNLFGSVASTVIIAVMLIGGGVLMWLIEQYHRAPQSGRYPDFDSLTAKQATQIGLFQVLALVPGVSRSGATIMGGLLVGVDRVTATAFSFYLSIPVLVLASGYKLATGWSDVAYISGGAPAVVAGVIASFITGLIAVKWLLKYVSHHNFKPFAYYRVVVGLLILALLAAGAL